MGMLAVAVAVGVASQKTQPCAAAVWARLNGLSQGAGAVKR